MRVLEKQNLNTSLEYKQQFSSYLGHKDVSVGHAYLPT